MDLKHPKHYALIKIKIIYTKIHYLCYNYNGEGMKNVELLQNNGVDIQSSIQLLGSMEFYDETLNEFLNEISNTLNKIKNYKEQNDLVNYSIEVHGLKSDSKYLGFTKLAELAYNHEIKSKENDINYVNAHYNELIMEAIRIVTIAKQYVGQPTQVESTEMPTGQTIIVADDSNIIRNFVNKILGEKFEILMAVDGAGVIDIIENNKDKNIVGLLLDLNMPNVNGFAVLEYFKQNNLFNKIPVSLITGDDTKDSVDRAFQYPIIDMLNKPFSENDVIRIVDRTIALHNSNN